MRADLSLLPSITDLLDHDDTVAGLIQRHTRGPVVDALRAAVDEARRWALETGTVPAPEQVVDSAREALARSARNRPRRVINATGVLLHTNLGRAPLASSAVAAMVDASGWTNLEFDLSTGQRRGRGDALHAQLARLCGSDAATTTNNGAAALVLALAAIAGGREVVVARGELIEIGGSFRLPEIIEASGVELREVGTTNRTRSADFRDAMTERTAAFLRVHPSNYAVVGFTERPDPAELATIATEAGVPLVHDIGSGLIDDHPTLANEPSARRALAQGADLVVFSGDKLIGGPQAGVVAGRADLVEACRRHPLARAFRLDKVRLSALGATLDAHEQGRLQDLPLWASMMVDVDDLRSRAMRIASDVEGAVVDLDAVVGGGSAPGHRLASVGVGLSGHGPTVLAALREQPVPVVGRLVDDRAVVDLRTVAADDDDELRAALTAVLSP